MVVPTAGFGTVYATTFNGTATVATALDVGGTARSGTSSNSKYLLLETEMVIYMQENYYGIATQAQYADLAEKYTADKEYEPGTVLVFGGEEEVTECTVFCDTRLAGVVPRMHI